MHNSFACLKIVTRNEPRVKQIKMPNKRKQKTLQKYYLTLFQQV